MAQQPTTATTFTAPVTTDGTPWPNTILASTNLFVGRASWPISPDVNEVPTSTFVKIEKAEERTLPKQVAITHDNKQTPEKQTSRKACG